MRTIRCLIRPLLAHRETPFRFRILPADVMRTVLVEKSTMTNQRVSLAATSEEPLPIAGCRPGQGLGERECP
jgi:hypothetical protein